MSEMLKLNQAKFDQALESFEEYSRDLRFKEDSKEREERKEFIQRLSREPFSELNFSSILKKLWAVQIWRNKDWVVQTIVSKNGIEKLSKEFTELVSQKGTPGERYERFVTSISDMGPAMVTEILCHTDPMNAGVWNDRARKALAWLEVQGISYEYKINGEEYDLFCQILKEIATILAQKGYPNVDLLFVGYFLWEVWDKFAHGEKMVRPAPMAGKSDKPTSRHDELRDKVAEIGSWLGFEVEKEKLVAIGAKLDAVWKARIANLGTVSYVFEVQDRGSIDGLMVNLQRAQSNPTVQKLVVVSDAEQLVRIQKEVAAMPESFRKALVFWDADDVVSTYQSLEQVATSIGRLGLAEEGF